MSYRRPDSIWSFIISDKVIRLDLLSLTDSLRLSRFIINCVVSSSDDIQEAYKLIKDLEPTTPQVLLPANWITICQCVEWVFILSGVICRSTFSKGWWMQLWDKKLDRFVKFVRISFDDHDFICVCFSNICLCILQRDHLKIAQQFFQLVGGSASECGNIIV